MRAAFPAQRWPFGTCLALAPPAGCVGTLFIGPGTNATAWCLYLFCVQVYVEPSQIGWRPLCTAWMEHQLPAGITAEQRERLQQLFEWLVDPCVAFVRKHCK